MHHAYLAATLLVAGLAQAAAAAASNYANCKPGTWQNLTSLPSPRQEHSTVALNDTAIAVVGGVVPAGQFITTTDLVQIYDIESDTWRTVAPTPYKVNHPNVVALDNKIYLLGGLVDGPLDPGEQLNWVATTLSYVYDPVLDSWAPLAPMPNGTERGSANTGVHGDIIYLAGGMTVLEQGYQDSIATVTAFNTSSGKWLRLPPAAAQIPEGRQHGLGAVVNGTFYVVGGRWFSQLNVRGTVFALDLEDLEAGWTSAAQQMPVPRGGIAGDAVGGSIFAFGGEGDVSSRTGVFPQGEAFDVRARNWTELVHMAVPRHGTHAAAAGGRIYIPGGGLQQDGKPVEVDGQVRVSHPTAHFDAYCA